MEIPFISRWPHLDCADAGNIARNTLKLAYPRMIGIDKTSFVMDIHDL
jgi:hypothetical protein